MSGAGQKATFVELNDLMRAVTKEETVQQRHYAGVIMVRWAVNYFKSRLASSKWSARELLDIIIQLLILFKPDDKSYYAPKVKPKAYDTEDIKEMSLKESEERKGRKIGGLDYWKQQIEYWLHAVFMIGYDFGDRIHHVCIDVRDDGSCLFQCLAHSLAFYDTKAPDTLLGLKQQMLLKAYRDDILNNKDRNDFQQTDINYGDTMRREDIMESMALKYNSEWECTENRMYRRDVISVSTWKNADTNLVLDIAAKAYTKQIILYTQTTRDPQKAGLAYNTRKTYFGKEARVEAKFTGQEVIIILHSPVRAHFYIVSRYPLMQGMTSDGRGIKGIEIPKHISIREMNIGEGNREHHPFMPFLQKCIGCNKFILCT